MNKHDYAPPTFTGRNHLMDPLATIGGGSEVVIGERAAHGQGLIQNKSCLILYLKKSFYSVHVDRGKVPTL